MFFLIGRTLFLTAGISLLACSATATGQEEVTPSKEYRCDKYRGDLAVFGRLTTTKPGIQLDQALVKLTRNGGDTLIDSADKDGRYCIRYSSGPDISRLSFEDGDLTCVEQISGSRSHYINKVLDNNCAQGRASVTLVGSNTTAAILTSAVAKKFWMLQAVLSNTSGGTLQIASFQFERESSKQGQSTSARDVIVPVDPEIVEVLVARQKSSVCLLCVGPVTLLQIPFHAHASDTEAYIRRHALRVNDIISDGQSEMKLIFVDKSKVPADKLQTGGLGNLVIRATKLTKAGESTLSTPISAENSVGSIARPVNERDADSVTIAVAKVK
jgi:hypothetical protein